MKIPRIILAYVPVVHEGYIGLFHSHINDGTVAYVMGEDLISELDYSRKEIRAIAPHQAAACLGSLLPSMHIGVMDAEDLTRLSDMISIVFMPDEDISRVIAKKYFSGKDVRFEKVFLRWDRDYTLKENEIQPDRIVERNEFVQEVMSLAYQESQRSSDWWRQIGAIAVVDGEVDLIAHNRHLPSPHSPYIFGDPRNTLKKGIHIELSTAIHAEAAIIAEAARMGRPLYGASLFVTTFPCPPCAKLIACSGIKKLYFREGYSMLDALEILKSHGVEIIWVK